MLSDPKKFYDRLKSTRLMGPVLDSSEFAGIEALLAACSGQPVAYVAYILATAYHETGGLMQPVKEKGGDAYFFRMYDPKGSRPAVAKRLGNIHPGDGVRFPGRGYPQTTGRDNYAKAAKFLGVDCVANPDLLLQAKGAAAWTVHAMVEGLFTTRRLRDDLPEVGPATLGQFVLTRDVVNGQDKRDKIAAEAMDFQASLLAGGWRA